MVGSSDKKILDVPMHSQLEIEDRYWMIRGCSVAALKMVLDYHEANTPDLLSMINEMNDVGGFGPSGWYHDAIVSEANKYGLNAYREEGMDESLGVEKIIGEIDYGNPVIVSTPKFILDRQKFHMVVIVGYEKNEDGSLKGLYYHDSESTESMSGENQFVSIGTFKKEWRKMAIFISKR